MKPGPRTFVVRLNCTGLKSTTETVERVVVDAYLALMSAPPYSLKLKFEEGSKPKQLLKHATTSLKESLQHAWFHPRPSAEFTRRQRRTAVRKASGISK